MCLLACISAITTVEGVLKRTIAGLMQDQPVRQHTDPEGAAQIEHYVAKIEALLRLQQPFHVVRTNTFFVDALQIRIRKFDVFFWRSMYYNFGARKGYIFGEPRKKSNDLPHCEPKGFHSISREASSLS